MPRGTGDGDEVDFLAGDPGLVLGWQGDELVGEWVRASGGESRQRFHLELDVIDAFIRLDALDFGGGQEISMATTHDSVRVGAPACRRIRAPSKFGDVAVVQVRERGVEVAGPSAGQVGTGVKARLAVDFQTNLKANVTSLKRQIVSRRRLTTMIVTALSFLIAPSASVIE